MTAMGSLPLSTKVRRAAAERLDAELARARKQVERAPPLHFKLDGGENALLDLVHGRAGIHALRSLQRDASGGSCDDAHAVPPSCG